VKITNLAISNIKKSKVATGSLFIFIVIAAVLLNVGLMVITQINPFFDKKVEQLKDPHVSIVVDEARYDSPYEEKLGTYPGVIETASEEIINMNIANYNFGTGELTNTVIIQNADAERNIGSMTLIEQLHTSSVNDIFLPYDFKRNGDYELGDTFNITYQAQDYQYRIAGFFEATMMGSSNINVMKFMLPETSFQELADELGNSSKGLLLFAVLENQSQSSKLFNDFTEDMQQSAVGEDDFYIWGLDIELVKSVITLTINIVATILVAFAVVIVLVSLIVIRFQVSNNIEDGIVNIGVLKAIGYTSGQILSSIILQYVFIALIAGIVGTLLSYTLIPFIGEIISDLSGLIWEQSFDITANVVSIILVVLSVVIVTLFSALRIRKIRPVAALRSGIQTHSFRKNYFPLDQARGGLHFLLALKSMLANAKQNMMILIIIIALTFASIFSVVLYYNISADKSAFIDLFGAEQANVMLVTNPDKDIREIIREMEQMDDVRKVNILDNWQMIIDDIPVYTVITEDYDLLENNNIFEGRQPLHDNEISISWVVADQINKGIGDMVEVKYGNESKSYLITGLSQVMGNLGMAGSLTMEGMQQLLAEYKGTVLYVYLDGVSNKDFTRNVQQQYGDSITETLDIDENIESQTGMYTAAVFAVMLMVLAITVLVVVLIMYLVIQAMIVKRKKEFGVMKAIGYSTIQLMHQLSISFVPVVFAGVAIGGVLGYFYTNPMISVLLSSTGVKRLEFIIDLPTILMVCVGILILAYIVSMLVARKIKKISAYGLITE